MRIAYAGTPEFAVPALRALVESRHEVVGVLTQPDRPKGRGRQLAASPVKQAAQSHGIPVSQPPSLRTEGERAELVSWRPDVLVVVAYGLILPRVVLDLPSFGCVNIHASLLPRWRGAAPIQRAVLAGDRETGVTIMQMDAGLDTGPMLDQTAVTIGPEENAGSLHDRLSVLGAASLLRVLDDIDSGVARAKPQPTEGMTYAAKIEKEEARIDWSLGAEEIARKVRAFNPSPIAETIFKGEQLRVYRAHAAARHAARPAGPIDASGPAYGGGPPPDPGAVLATTADGVVVSCGLGHLVLTEVQRPGRRPISGHDFANTPDLLGSRLS